MKKFIFTIFLLFLSIDSLTAKDNKKLSNEELMVKIMSLDNEQKSAKAETIKMKARTKEMKNKTISLEKIVQTLEKATKK